MKDSSIIQRIDLIVKLARFVIDKNIILKFNRPDFQVLSSARRSDNFDRIYASLRWFGLALRYIPVVARDTWPSWSWRSPTGTPPSRLQIAKLCLSR
jgi:hypothetical protein